MTNRKSTKRALLGSVMAMVLCLAMLVGATFAWFTDTASTGVNKIQAGNLDIEIQDENGNAIKNLAWKTQEGTAFDEEQNPLWEPGCTYTLTPFQIVNKGNLALKYKIVVTGLEGDAGLLKVIKFTYKTGEETFDMNAEGHLAANGGTTGMITVSAHMDEAAGNEYMNKTLEGVKFTVYATQDTVESDSFHNTYDENATYPVANVTELKEALTTGGVVALAKDVALVPEVADTTVSTLVPQMTMTKDTTLDLSGKKLAVDASAANADYGKASPLMLAVMGGTLTITGDGELNCEAGNNQVYGINVNGGKVVIESGKFYGAMTAIQVQKGSLEIKGGFFDMAPTCKAAVPQYAKYVVNCIDAAYKNGTATISITGGTFVNFDPSANPEGAGTSYVADGYKVVSAPQTNGDVWYTVVKG